MLIVERPIFRSPGHCRGAPEPTLHHLASDRWRFCRRGLEERHALVSDSLQSLSLDHLQCLPASIDVVANLTQLHTVALHRLYIDTVDLEAPASSSFQQKPGTRPLRHSFRWRDLVEFERNTTKEIHKTKDTKRTVVNKPKKSPKKIPKELIKK